MTKKEIEKVVEMTVDTLLTKFQGSTPKPAEKWITSAEAAKILGFSTYRLRMIKDQFQYKKDKSAKNGRLLFLQSSIENRFK